MKKLMIVCVLALWVGGMVGGCISGTDPETGKKTYSADPCTVAKLEQGTEGAIGILGILSAFWPALIPVATGAAGAYGVYKRTKPKLDEAKTTAELYHTSTHTLVAVIEDIKKNEPETWAKLKPYLKDSKMGANIENVIRALRGLPPT